MSSIVINNIKNIENYSYLELGIFDNKNFETIKCKEKFSVDTNGNAMFTGTTDEYFQSISKDKKFDIIFIDANHDYDFVLRDFNNAVDHATKWILIHDMIPPSKKYIQQKYCSDSYKLLHFFLEAGLFKVYPMEDNFGLTLIKMPVSKVYPKASYAEITHQDFKKLLSSTKLYTNEEIVQILNEGMDV